MHLHILALLFFLSSSFSCQQDPEAALSSATNIGLPSGSRSQQPTEKDRPLAVDVVYKSTDGGQTWQDVSAGLPQKLMAGCVFVDGGEIFLATEFRLYHSSTAAAAPSWKNEDFFNTPISNLFHGSVGAYIGSYGIGLYKNIPDTDVLIPMHGTLKDLTVRGLVETAEGTLFVGCESGIYKTTDGGKNWKQVYAEMGVNSLVAADGIMLSGTYKGMIRSTDDGEHWEQVMTKEGGAYRTIAVDGGFVTMADDRSIRKADPKQGLLNKLFLSTDSGKTWQHIDEGLYLNPYVSNALNAEDDLPLAQNIFDVQQVGKYLFCSTEAGVFRSSDRGKTWDLVFHNDGKKILNISGSGQVIYAALVAGC